MADDGKRASAVALAEMGFRVFRLYPGSKKPLHKGFPDKASNDVPTVRGWWTDEDGWAEDFNIGVLTGEKLPDGRQLHVIDVDNKPGKTGWDALEELQLMGLDIDTMRVTTPTGGIHLYYGCPPDWPQLSSGPDRLGRGIDTRGFHGYVVGPGSSTDVGTYDWTFNKAIATLPDWMLEHLQPRRALGSGAGEWVVEADLPASLARAREHAILFPVPPEGTRNRQMTMFGMDMHDLGVSPEMAIEIGLEHWPLMQDAALHEEFEKTVNSAYRSAQRAAGILSPAFQFDDVSADLEPAAVKPPPVVTRKSKVYSLLEAAAMVGEVTTPYLIRDLLDVGAMSVVYGKSGSGKTFLALDIAYAVASGNGWHGRNSRMGGVLYVVAEGGRGIFKRAAGIIERNGNADVPMFFAPTSVDLFSATSTDARMLVDIVREREQALGVKFELVVVDTLARAMAGGDENSTKDMSQFVKTVDKLREHTSAHVMLIHHSGKDESRGARGSSSLRAATDTEIEVQANVMTVRKQRDRDIGLPVGFRIVPVKVGVDDEGANIMSCYVELVDPKVIMAEQAATAANPTRRKIKAGLDVGRCERFLQAMNDAWDAGEQWVKARQIPARNVVAKAVSMLGLDRKAAAELLFQWEADGRIEEHRSRVGGVSMKGMKALKLSFDEAE